MTRVRKHPYWPDTPGGPCRTCAKHYCDYSDLDDRIDRRARLLGMTRSEFLATDEGARALKAKDVT